MLQQKEHTILSIECMEGCGELEEERRMHVDVPTRLMSCAGSVADALHACIASALFSCLHVFLFILSYLSRRGISALAVFLVQAPENPPAVF